MQGFLEKIYDGFDTSEAIEPSVWREVLKHMNEASVEGLVASGHPTHEEAFLKTLRHSNEVFSAFKTHSMGSLMQARLLDKEGKLRPFKEWREAVAPIVSHHTRAWLKTEYDTAVLRAHQAADWQEFLANRDVLPNLRWMPTTSPTPEEAHRAFWSSGLTLPIDDPFWADNHPANRWNCKCSLEATSDPASPEAVPNDSPKAQRGLEENPRHGHTFSDKHPYYPKSCKACPFYGKAKAKGKSKVSNLLEWLFDNRQKDCHNCPHVDYAISKAELNDKYPTNVWEHTYISPTGGYVVTEHQRIEETKSKEGKPDKNEVGVFKKEQDMAKALADLGNKIEHLAEKTRPIDQRYDVHFNGIPADLKSTKSANNIIKYAKKAFQTQGADMVIIRFEQRCSGIEDEFKGVRRRFPNKRILYYFEDEKVLHEYP